MACLLPPKPVAPARSKEFWESTDDSGEKSSHFLAFEFQTAFRTLKAEMFGRERGESEREREREQRA